MEQKSSSSTEPSNKPHPVITGGGKHAITLWHKANPATSKHPDLSGAAIVDGVRYGVSGWFVKGGVKPNGEPYGPFVSLLVSKYNPNATSQAERYKRVGGGTMNAVNMYGDKPADGTRRSRVVGNLKIFGQEHSVTGFVTDELVRNQWIAKLIGFDHEVAVPERPAQQASSGADNQRNPAPSP